MSICPKNKSSKGRRDKQKSKLENGRYEPYQVQQVRRADCFLTEYARTAVLTTREKS